MRRVATCLSACLVGVLACGDTDSASGPDAGTIVTPDAGPDLTARLFDPNRVIEVEITMDAADWDALRVQARSIDMLFGDDCQAQPFPKPYTFFPATVTVDGITVEQVGVRKKGFLGSLDDNKPSLKLKFDEYIPDQTVSGMQRLTLNNNRQDPAFIKQCIGYGVFRDAGIPAPRCNFAHVTVNGMNLGLFANVESMKKPFLRRHFADDEGVLYEGTLSDFRDGWLGTFEQKTNKTMPSTTAIDELYQALRVSSSGLLDALAPHLDVDEFINFWATEVLIAHWDGYANNTNNFFFYDDPVTGQVHFMPWGIDGILFDANPFPDGPAPPKVVYATGYLTRRLYNIAETRTRYITRLRELLDEVWDESALIAEIDRMEALVIDIAEADPFAEGVDVRAEIELVRQFVRQRRQVLGPELDNPPVWDYPLRDSFCFGEVGSIQGSFTTTYGDLNRDPFTAGTASITGTLDGAVIIADPIGSRAGLNAAAENGPKTEIHVVGVRNGNLLFVVFAMPPEAFGPGTYTLDFATVESFLFEWDTTAMMGRIIGFLADGTLTLSDASATAGGAVAGSFSATILESPF